ncbi:MAG: bifunctional diaminohydroxyphosphoribosylaminopyrimidine deaminase/5-amino-6-(5-phosphoribosylamino)uracil reductase RibD [Deltaproteobacteria bacterium]|nr:bifunctional diaminohydroxyphosphoribosylaminopyrimidine deaminase/5-amino-6-(5-phosphoribosylamino)uracil reductase RibD [Deltaproteobacteria bacterium]
MSRAIELALKAKGHTSPNPIVGAVVSKRGKIIAEAFHKQAGADHAEVAALKKIGKSKTKGATLYVTLEPCCHHGKTGPCVPKVIESGIQRVVIGARDPNPKVNGQGIRWLKEAGIEVIEGVLQDRCEELNRPFQKHITTHIPYVTLKVAMTLDGKIATASGDSRWISNPLSRKYVHQMRDEVDAILVGANTLKTDDPLLNIRLVAPKNGRHPMVVVVDQKLDVPINRRLFSVKGRRVVFATTWMSPEENRRALIKMGAEVWPLDADVTGRVDLKALLKMLGEKQIVHVLIEGGGGIFSSFLSEKLVDRLVCFMAPKLLGGQAMDWLPELNIRTLDEALELNTLSVKTLGDNILVEGELKRLTR